jgi:hypothetical protein
LVPIMRQINPVHTTPTCLSKIHLGPPSCALLSDFLTDILHVFFLALIHATCPANLTFLDFIILTILGKGYMLWSSSLCSFLQPPANLSLLGPNILLSTPFSNTLSLCFSLNARDKVSHPHRTKDKIIDFYIISFMILRRQKVLDWMVASITQIQSPINFLLKHIDFLMSSPDIWNIR